MRIGFFSTQPYDRATFEDANAAFGHELVYFEPRLTAHTASLADGFDAVCAFVNDVLDAAVLGQLARQGTRVVALRSAGFNNVDLAEADRLGLAVVRVPAYSPAAVAEHTVALILALDRHIPRAHARVRDGNFALHGLLGFDLQGKVVGIVGTGKIGSVVSRIMTGFGCRVLAFDLQSNPECLALGVEYVDKERLFAESDVITLHCPLTPDTHHLIGEAALRQMKPGVMLVNTSRGAVLDTVALIAALKTGRVGYLGLDVYEEEADLFFRDLSDRAIQDDVFARLLTFPNVLVTGHQAFFTREALAEIAETTLASIADEEAGRPSPNRVTAARLG